MNAPSPAPITPATPAPPKPELAWLGAADIAILILVVLLAGLVAAHVSRVSDQWLHFAAGRDLLSGKYSLGSDPYSYTAADRIWVNHNWLYDLAVYELYSLDGTGKIVIAAKAIVFALSFAVVLGIRRRGSAAWPWWLVAVIAVLAAAPFASLRPVIDSGFMVALFLYLLFRSPWRDGSWRNPLICAGLTAIWANLDVWFLLAPAILAVVLFAEVVQRKILNQDDGASDSPPIADLAKALLLCLFATMLNPHHVRVWQLPIEFGIGLPPAIAQDGQFAVLRMSPLSKDYWKSPQFGGNANGYAAAVLLLGGGGLLALGMARIRLAYLFVWVLFALLALAHYRLILLFAIAAVPLAAMPLADFAARFATDNRTRLPQALSSVSRLIALPALLILLLCAWPGWLHPMPADPGHANRVALGVESDPGYERAARLANEWRESGKLPDSLHGTPLTIELANHMAWFAPKERVAVNGRFQHHLAELPALLAARATFNDQEVKLAKLNEAMASLGADYIFTKPPYQAEQASVAQYVVQILNLTLGTNAFALWHLDGRTAVLANGTAAKGVALQFDPVKLAFAADQPPLPEPVLMPPPSRTRDFFDDFVQSPKPLPFEAFDALAYQIYASKIWEHAVQSRQLSFAMASAALVGPPMVAGSQKFSMVFPPTPDAVIAANLLGQRAARRAMAANPDHPLAYLALAHCVAPGEYPVPGFSEKEQDTLHAAMSRHYLDRIPLPGDAVSFDLFHGYIEADALANYYGRNQMLDLTREARRLSIEYQKRWLPMEMKDKDPEQIKRKLEDLDKFLAKMNAQYAERLQNFQALATAPVPQRFDAAMRNQLIGEAIKILQTCDLEKEFGENARGVELFGIQLRLRAVMLEDAILAITAYQEKHKATDDPNQALQLLPLYAEAQRLAGDYAALGKTMDANPPQAAGLTPQQRDILKQALRSPMDYQLAASGVLPGSLGGGTILFLEQRAHGDLTNAWLYDANTSLRRALVPLLDGRIGEAKALLEKSLIVDGIPVPPFLAERGIAERYLKLIESGGTQRR